MTSNTQGGAGSASQPGGIERRTAPRVPNHPDDHVIINRLRLRLQNWSRNGLLFGPMANPPALHAKIEVTVAVMINNQRVRFEATGQVMRVVAGNVAVMYQCMTADALPKIRAYFDTSG